LTVPEGRLARAGVALSNWSERWFPDPLVFALIGIVVVFLIGIEGIDPSLQRLGQTGLARPPGPQHSADDDREPSSPGDCGERSGCARQSRGGSRHRKDGGECGSEECRPAARKPA